MKIFAFALRPFDELAYLERACHELNIEFDWTSEYPTLENASLAAGADALTIITNPMTAELLDRYHELGIRAIATRSARSACAWLMPPIRPKALQITPSCSC